MAKFYLYNIVDPDPEAMTHDRWLSLSHLMASSGWTGRSGQRMGFVHTVRSNGTIGGYFAREGQKKGIQYDDNKEPKILDPYYSFEHLFFVLFEDTTQLLLQSIRAYGYSDLRMGEMRENFLHLLADQIELGGGVVFGDSVGIEPAGARYSQDQLYTTFRTMAQVTELEIANLDWGRIPPVDDPKYRLFNPKDEWNEITWGAVVDTLKAGADAVKMSAPDQPGSTLQSPIPKALAAVGRIDKLAGRDENGSVFIRQRIEDLELEIELPAQVMSHPELIDSIVKRLDARGRVENWKQSQAIRQEELNRGTLLDKSYQNEG